jgi:ABC-type sugar transport system ATPase subunit
MEPLLRLEGISKAFAGVPVLEDVSMEVAAGEVHALIGENGAGKSTLMKIATGALHPDAGRIVWKGQTVILRNPRQAHALGIAIVHQELMLVPSLSVSENIFLGRHPATRRVFRWVRWGEMHRRARALLGQLGHDIDPRQPVGELSIAEQQLVEIARALAFNADLIVMDEPTSPLSEHETERLFRIIRQLKERGVSIIYITHRLREIYDLADRVTVLRDGHRIATAELARTTPDELVRWMVGREIGPSVPASRPPARRDEVLRVEGLTARGKFADITFSLHRGEILGIAGLVGAGRTHLLESLFGAPAPDAGRIFLNGRPVVFKTPADAVRHGIALVTDDRKAKGLVPGGSLRLNVALTVKERLARLGLFLSPRRERELAERFTRELRIKARDTEQPVISLSGGNQQKVVLAKWLAAESSVFLLDEPTRGIDVASKVEIYDLIRRLAAEGAAILLVSSELEEILRLADRILVMHRGRIVGHLDREHATEERIMQLATGATYEPTDSHP